MRQGAWQHVHEHGDESYSSLTKRLPDDALLRMIEGMAGQFNADVTHVYDPRTNKDIPISAEMRQCFSAALLEYWTRCRAAPGIVTERAIKRLPDVRDTWPDRRRTPRYSTDVDTRHLHQPLPSAADILADLPTVIRRGRLNGWNGDQWTWLNQS